MTNTSETNTVDAKTNDTEKTTNDTKDVVESNLLKDCKSLFDTSNLYEILGLKKDSNKDDIKNAYHNKALSIHPDRTSEENNKKFETLTKVYSLLINDDKRKEYDDKNIVNDGGDENIDSKSLFRKLTNEENINKFFDKYKSSDDEKKDLINLYKKNKGDMSLILSEVLSENIADNEKRFREIIQNAIDKDNLEVFEKFKVTVEVSASAGGDSDVKKEDVKESDDVVTKETTKTATSTVAPTTNGDADKATEVKKSPRGRAAKRSKPDDESAEEVVSGEDEKDKDYEEEEEEVPTTNTRKRGGKKAAAPTTPATRKTPSRGSKAKSKAVVEEEDDEDEEEEAKPAKKTPNKRATRKTATKKDENVEEMEVDKKEEEKKEAETTPIKKANGNKKGEKKEEEKEDEVDENKKEEIEEKKTPARKGRKAAPLPPKRDPKPTRHASKNISYADLSEDEEEEEEIHYEDPSSEEADINESDDDYGKKSRKKTPNKGKAKAPTRASGRSAKKVKRS